MGVTNGTETTGTARRREWLSTLAHAPRVELLTLADRVLAPHAFTTLRAPELGLLMVQGRLDGEGDRFNVGEATVARCVVRFDTAMPTLQTIGVGYRLGRDLARVACMARLDALLQQPAFHGDVMAVVVHPLHTLIEQGRSRAAAEQARSRVRFLALDTETSS